jgi:two-component system response regulator FixJ
MDEQQTPIVYVVDNDQPVCRALGLLIKGVGLDVCTYNSAEDFLAGYDPDRQSCLVVDVRMPGMSGLDLQNQLNEQGINLPTIVVTEHGDIPMAVDAIKAGVVDFMEKPFRSQLLLDNIHKALQLSAQSRSRQAVAADIKTKTSHLTPREKEIMNFLVDGRPSKTIAYELGISRKTVDFHRTHILEKMGVNSVVKLVLLTRQPQPT